jgi:hypothetical protein
MNPELQQRMASMLGSGMARQAGNQLMQAPRYQDYAIQMQTNGMQVLPQNDPNWIMHYQQFMQQQQPQGLLGQAP